MSTDNYTKCVLTGIWVCLLLITAKQYNIVAEAEAQRGSSRFQSDVSSANQVMDVNIVSINGKTFDQYTPALPVNVRFIRDQDIPTFADNVGKTIASIPIMIRGDNQRFYFPETTNGRLRVKASP